MEVSAKFSIINLKKGKAALELIQLSGTLSPADIVPDYTSKTRIYGFFKMGFQVTDLDTWVSFLKEKQVEFNGDVVTDLVTNKRMVITLDPDGNRIQLFEQ